VSAQLHATDCVITRRLRHRSAAFLRTDLGNWDDQVALFELAIAKFNSVDIVVRMYLQICVTQAYFYQVVNAGVREIGDFETVKLVDGLPVKPNLKTIEINLLTALHSAYGTYLVP
jgi:hypothetical protein